MSQQQQPALVTPNTFTLCLHILVVLASNSTTISLQLLRQVKVFSQQKKRTRMAFMLGPLSTQISCSSRSLQNTASTDDPDMNLLSKFSNNGPLPYIGRVRMVYRSTCLHCGIFNRTLKFCSHEKLIDRVRFRCRKKEYSYGPLLFIRSKTSNFKLKMR